MYQVFHTIASSIMIFKYKLYWLEKRKTYIKNRHWKNKRKRIEEELRILFHIDVYGGGQ